MAGPERFSTLLPARRALTVIITACAVGPFDKFRRIIKGDRQVLAFRALGLLLRLIARGVGEVMSGTALQLTGKALLAPQLLLQRLRFSGLKSRGKPLLALEFQPLTLMTAGQRLVLQPLALTRIEMREFLDRTQH